MIVLYIRCSFLESKQRERRGQHHFFLLPGRSVQLEKGEFLCPLCQSPCNTVLPLLIPRPLTTPPRRPANEISPAEWIDLVQMATDLADGDHMDTSEWEGVIASPKLVIPNLTVHNLSKDCPISQLNFAFSNYLRELQYGVFRAEYVIIIIGGCDC